MLIQTREGGNCWSVGRTCSSAGSWMLRTHAVSCFAAYGLRPCSGYEGKSL